VEVREIHPLRKSPVITEADRVIAESGAIIDYIVRRHGDGLRNLP
jgi:glutathione S-transferase